MAAALLFRGRRAASPPSITKPSSVRLVLVATLGLAIGLASISSGYYDSRIWAPAGIVLAGVVVGLFVLRGDSLRASPAIAVLAVGGLGLWSLASAGWTPSPHEAVAAGNLLLVYAILLAVLVVLVDDRRAVTWLLGAMMAGVTIVAGIVMGRMAFADDPSALFAAGRLSDPLGYANGQGSVFMLAVFPSLALAERLRSPLVAGLGAAGIALFAGLAMLSGARGVLLAGLVALAVVLLVLPGRTGRLAAVLTAAAALTIAAPTLIDVLSDRADPADLDAAVEEGARRLMLAVVVAGLGWCTLVALHARSPALIQRRVRAIWLGAIRVALVIAVGVALLSAPQIGDRLERGYDAFVGSTSAESEAAPETRLTAGGGARYDYWRVSMDVWQAHPLVGIGAGVWGGAYLAQRETTEDVDQPHSLPLRTLAELGVVGAALLVAGLGALLWAALRGALAARASSHTEWAPLVAALGMGTGWVIHTSVDWMHLIPGVTGMAICAAAVVLCGRWSASPLQPGDHRTQRRIQWVLLGILVTVAVVSLTRQSLAEHYRARTENALAATPSKALKLADRSIRFQREALPAYYLKAAALARLGRGLPAEHVLREAIRREPDNFLNFALLGDLLVRRGELARARAAYGTALRLKPLDLQLRNYVRDPRQALQPLTDATGRPASGLGGPIR